MILNERDVANTKRQNISNIILFSGDAASFKGGRSYVHGTDTLPFIDACVSVRDQGVTVSKIEFFTPLTTRGVLVINPSPYQLDKGRLNASGLIRLVDGSDVPFIVFASPITVDSEMRPFEEEALMKNARVSNNNQSVNADRCANLTTAEHVSSLMKLLCQSLLPYRHRWWFVRLQKATMLPETFSNIEINCKRVIAKSMVSAGISFDGVYFGSIDFVGAVK